MLVAEIRRKLIDLEDVDAEEDDALDQIRSVLSTAKEDLLTADVFGTLKYLPADVYLKSVLSAIASGNPASGLAEKLRGLDLAEGKLAFLFWPGYPTPRGLPGQTTEPDVELVGGDVRLFFEAKLGSGFGELQVARQLLIGLERPDGREFFLVLVTAGLGPPRLRLAGRRLRPSEYVHAVAAKADLDLGAGERELLRANAGRVLWTSWRQVASAIEQAHAQPDAAGGVSAASRAGFGNMIADLSSVLSMRGLAPFRGVGRAAAERAVSGLPAVMPARRRFVRFSGLADVDARALAAGAEGLVLWRPASADRARPGPALQQVFRHRAAKPLPAKWLCRAGADGMKRRAQGMGRFLASLPPVLPASAALPGRRVPARGAGLRPIRLAAGPLDFGRTAVRLGRKENG